MVMPLIVGQEWRRRISRMQWLLNAVLAVECLSMPFFARKVFQASAHVCRLEWLLEFFSTV